MLNNVCELELYIIPFTLLSANSPSACASYPLHETKYVKSASQRLSEVCVTKL